MHTSLASGLQEQGWEAGLSKADSILTLRTILEAEENYPSRATALWGDMTGNGPPALASGFFPSPAEQGQKIKEEERRRGWGRCQEQIFQGQTACLKV